MKTRGKILSRCSSEGENEAILPVNPAALQILEKYEYNFSWGTNQQANHFLKAIATMAGIDDILDTDPPVMKSQMATTHTARRSAATNLRLQGANHCRERALDGTPGENSPFATTLLHQLKGSQDDLSIWPMR